MTLTEKLWKQAFLRQRFRLVRTEALLLVPQMELGQKLGMGGTRSGLMELTRQM